VDLVAQFPLWRRGGREKGLTGWCQDSPITHSAAEGDEIVQGYHSRSKKNRKLPQVKNRKGALEGRRQDQNELFTEEEAVLISPLIASYQSAHTGQPEGGESFFLGG